MSRHWCPELSLARADVSRKEPDHINAAGLILKCFNRTRMSRFSDSGVSNRMVSAGSTRNLAAPI